MSSVRDNYAKRERHENEKNKRKRQYGNILDDFYDRLLILILMMTQLNVRNEKDREREREKAKKKNNVFDSFVSLVRKNNARQLLNN